MMMVMALKIVVLIMIVLMMVTSMVFIQTMVTMNNLTTMLLLQTWRRWCSYMAEYDSDGIHHQIPLRVLEMAFFYSISKSYNIFRKEVVNWRSIHESKIFVKLVHCCVLMMVCVGNSSFRSHDPLGKQCESIIITSRSSPSTLFWSPYSTSSSSRH